MRAKGSQVVVVVEPQVSDLLLA
ncbi:MAG: hypothetical protein H6Q51_50, partial [Deltaproteobacteria bacterium]|nr:hypothetical protein [Deltaproteobacteria bacterium]